MIRSVSFKLILAFLLVSITGAVLTAFFARWATFHEFDSLVLEQVKSNFMANVTNYYEAHGSWVGAKEFFQPPGLAPVPPPRPRDRSELLPPSLDQSRHRPPTASYVFALADTDGRVIMPAGPYLAGNYVPAEELAQGIEVIVDGQVVGIALLTGDAPELNVQEQLYLERTNEASFFAALAATFIAVVFGVILTRTLTRPVRDMMVALQAMSQGKLEQQVPVRSQDELGKLAMSFNQMSAELAHANELRRQMTADIAHDLRTPLTVMAGYIEALRDGVLKPSSDRFETMYQEAQYLKRLVEDLRTLSLADASELALNRDRVPPRMVLEQAMISYRHRAEQQGVDLRMDAVPDLPSIDVDPDRMAQVLGNLVDNAFHYTPPDGQVLLSAAQRDKQVLLTVQDTGAGIAPEDLPHVFDRFYRSDKSRQGDDSGSGLGLAIARSIVELHGGTISVESMVGKGTIFTVTLPACG